MISHKKHYLIFALFLCQFFMILTAIAATHVITTIDRNNISAGETFKLTISINGEFNSERADTTELENDFIIVSSMVFPQMSAINGKVTQRTDINLILAPKRAGTLIIPKITIGKYASNPQTIIVSPETAKPANTNKQLLFLESEVDNKSPFVQGQVIYRARLFVATTISNGTLSDPVVKNAIIMPLDEAQEYQKTIKDTLYQVYERSYAIFPQRSGNLSIDPIVFSGMKSSNMDTPGFNSFFTDTQIPVRLFSPTITLNVKPIPANANSQNWLPSKNLNIEENWSIPSSLKVGDLITRSIKMTAKGNIASQLPKLNVNNNVSEHVNVYSDNLKTNTKVVNENMIAESEQDIAYIPSQAGEIHLPEITVSWWDTNTNQLQITKLPGKKILLSPLNTQNSAVSKDANQTVSPVIKQTVTQLKSVVSQQTKWIYVSFILFLLWTATIIFIYRERINKYFQPKTNNKINNTSEKQILRQLKIACKQQDVTQVKHYLETWGKHHWPEKTTVNLGSIAKEINDAALTSEIQHLSTLLYSGKKLDWNGEKLWQAFQAYLSQNTSRKKANQGFDLPPLYPK